VSVLFMYVQNHRARTEASRPCGGLLVEGQCLTDAERALCGSAAATTCERVPTRGNSPAERRPARLCTADGHRDATRTMGILDAGQPSQRRIFRERSGPALSTARSGQFCYGALKPLIVRIVNPN
jgi:hypothetical protein